MLIGILRLLLDSAEIGKGIVFIVVSAVFLLFSRLAERYR